MLERALPVLATTLALAATPASAAGGDAAVTRAYIQADYALVHTARANLGTSEAALRTLRRRIAAECPRAAAGSPQNADSEQLSNELVGAMTVAAIQPDGRAVAAFARAVAGLRWSDGALTRRVHSYAGRLRTLSLLPPPDVCADVRAWAASGYRTRPASSVSFDARYYKVEVAVGEVPARLLAPFEQPGVRPLLARARQLEGELSEAEANAVGTWGKIMESLALSP